MRWARRFRLENPLGPGSLCDDETPFIDWFAMREPRARLAARPVPDFQESGLKLVEKLKMVELRAETYLLMVFHH